MAQPRRPSAASIAPVPVTDLTKRHARGERPALDAFFGRAPAGFADTLTPPAALGDALLDGLRQRFRPVRGRTG